MTMLNEICVRHKSELNDFLETWEMSDSLFQDLYNYYFDQMPIGTRKARDADPYEWVAERFSEDVYCEMELNLNE
jgi:hypothetical protein